MAAEESQIFMTFGGYLLNMASAVAGGLLVIAGNHITAGKSHKLNQESSKLQLKKEKLEQLVTAAYKARHWLEKNQQINLLGCDLEPLTSPIYRVDMLSKLYVPELKHEVQMLIMETNSYRIWISEQRKRLPVSDSSPEEFESVYNQLYNSVENITDKVAKIMEDIDNH